VYDPKIDGWRITFVAAVAGATVNLIAREHGDEIWLEGRAPDNKLFRWTFSDFNDERVRWQGFVSSDEGPDLVARRRDHPSSAPVGASRPRGGQSIP
jgi:hypothetical protein